MGPQSSEQRIEILSSIPQNQSDSLFKKLERIGLPKHQLLHEMARPMRFVYFLNDGLASLLNVMKDGKSVEVGLIGKEGFVGLPLLAGFLDEQFTRRDANGGKVIELAQWSSPLLYPSVPCCTRV